MKNSVFVLVMILSVFTLIGTSDARWYDAQTGRFISRDPIGTEGGINLYGYCVNNPINFIDETGLSTATYCRNYTRLIVNFRDGSSMSVYAADNVVRGHEKVPDDTYTAGNIKLNKWKGRKWHIPSEGIFIPINVPDIFNIGIHAGRASFIDRTLGCVRIDKSQEDVFLKRVLRDPIERITFDSNCSK